MENCNDGLFILLLSHKTRRCHASSVAPTAWRHNTRIDRRYVSNMNTVSFNWSAPYGFILNVTKSGTSQQVFFLKIKCCKFQISLKILPVEADLKMRTNRWTDKTKLQVFFCAMGTSIITDPIKIYCKNSRKLASNIWGGGGGGTITRGPWEL